MLGGLQTLLTGILAEILVRIYYQRGSAAGVRPPRVEPRLRSGIS